MNASFRINLRLLAVVAAATTVACSGGNSSPVAPIAPTGATPGNTAGSSGGPAIVNGDILRGATFVGRAHLRTLGFDVLMTMRDLPGLLAYAQAANDPASGSFRQWLTPQQLGDRFGADVRDYQSLERYLAANGIAYKGYPQRQTLRVWGGQSNLERAFGVRFGYYRRDGQLFLAPIGAPAVPASLHVAAFANVVRYRLKSRRLLPLRISNSFAEGYSPEQLANVFDYTGAYAAGFKGDGITIGVIGTAAITDGDPRIAGGDVKEYRVLYDVGGTGIVRQDVDTASYSPGDTAAGPPYEYSQSGLATPPPVTSGSTAGCMSQGFDPSNPAGTYGNITDFQTCNPEDIEAQLDTEQAAALAPDANVNFYIAYNPSECYGPCSSSNPPSQQLGLAESDDETQQAIADNASDIITMSFGADEASSQTQFGYYNCSPPPSGNPYGCGSPAPSNELASNNYGPMEYASLAAEGIAVFAASGDNGAEACNGGINSADQPCVDYPATDPSVISVGGVNTPLDNSGRLTGPITGWGTQTQIPGSSTGGSGGGCSIYFKEPSYASGVSLPCKGMRVQPDAALDADTNTGVAVTYDSAPGLGGRQIFAVGGTSVSTPEMAAMWALVLQACKQSAACSAGGSVAAPHQYRLGNPGIYLYKIYQSATQYPATFYDVLFGDNSLPNSSGNGSLDPGYTAGKGYDLVTGIGVPYAHSLIASVLADVP